MNWQQAKTISDQVGDAFFIFHEKKFRENFNSLQSAFTKFYPPTKIGYSYKTNYTPYLCKIIDELGGYAEVVSDMEFRLAQRIGVPGEKIIFNGPCKKQNEFNDAASLGVTLNIDSMEDIYLAQSFASRKPDQKIKIVLRCNFPLRGDDISRFGIDTNGEDFQKILAIIGKTPSLFLRGLHCHFPDRDLDSFAIRAKKLVKLAQVIFPDKPPQTLNIGGGLFSNLPQSMRQNMKVEPASFEEYAQLVGGIFSQAYPDENNRPTLFLEPGTAVVADTFSFYTKVLSTRKIRGRAIATTAGSMFDISPNARSRNMPVTVIQNEQNTEQNSQAFQTYDVVGFTCIESDILTEQLSASILPGDFIRYDNVGSYSLVMRPPFILPARAAFAHQPNGKFHQIKRAQSNVEVFTNFEF